MIAVFALSLLVQSDGVQSDGALSALEPVRLEALHRQRLEWMKTRRVDPPHGVYVDLRAADAPPMVPSSRLREMAKSAGVHVVLGGGSEGLVDGVLFMNRPVSAPPVPATPRIFSGDAPKPKELKRLFQAFQQYPSEFAGLAGLPPLLSIFKGAADKAPLATITQHILAKSLSAEAVREGFETGRTYSSEEWLCDSSGFALWAVNNQGVFEIGDRVPLENNTRLQVRLPVSGHVQLFRDGVAVESKDGNSITFPLQLPGAYHIEAQLDAGGTSRAWIRTQPLRAAAREAMRLPDFSTQDESVRIIKDVPYVENAEPKQKMDLYLPKDKTGFPVFVFLHGGAWASGDRSIYAPLGVMFAKRGIGVAIPSYRLMPKNPHPAQVDDAAAAFAWVAKNIDGFGADMTRIFLGGHSAGGHLAALIALDKTLLARHNVSTSVIRGVAAMSGVYDVRLLPSFGEPEVRKKSSPAEYVRRDSPPFLITYCQWDYLGLPQQAKDLTAALKHLFVNSRLLFVPGKTHITEMLSVVTEGDPTAEAILHLIETGQP